MAKLSVKLPKKYVFIALGSSVSILLLIIFFVFQYVDSVVLKLESRWIAVAIIPLFSVLFAGGYIKNFKGFGVELETNLSKPIVNLELSATEAMEAAQAMEEVGADEKQSAIYLYQISDEEKKI